MQAADLASLNKVARGLLCDYPALLEADAPPPDGEDPEHENALEEGARRLRSALAGVHPADLADLLESLPLEERLAAWRVLDSETAGLVMIEVSERVFETLLDATPEADLARALTGLPADDIAALLRDLPAAERARLARLVGVADDESFRASLSFPEETVGAIMDFAPVTARADESIAAVVARLQESGELPSHCDKLFVVNDYGRLVGVLPLKRLLLNPPAAKVAAAMVARELYFFAPGAPVEEAASAFEKYDLISAPVVDSSGRVVGRLTIDELFEHVHNAREQGLLSAAGIAEEEDLFAPVLRRFKNRWAWLGFNLVAVFLISRVVGLFETAIGNFVALASLMPIIAGMSGSIGNQTATLTVRALALGQITSGNWLEILRGEMRLSVANGAVWGGLAAFFGYALYGRLDLSAVLLVSMLLGFAVAALSGFATPLVMQRLGRDPALGASVVLTTITDIAGFGIFLALGALFLV